MTANVKSLPRYGYSYPRFGLTPESSSVPLWRLRTHGFEVIRWCQQNLSKWDDEIGEYRPLRFLPWQKYVLIRALEVDENGDYVRSRVVCLVGRQAGKSTLISALAAYWLCHNDSVIYSSASVEVAAEQHEFVAEYIESNPAIFGNVKVRRTNGQVSIAIPKHHTKYSIAAQTRAAGRGRTARKVVVDEARELVGQQGAAALNALLPTTFAKRNSQVWIVSNAGDESSQALNTLVAQGRLGTASRTAYFEYSAPDQCEIFDRAMWRYHPGFGHYNDEVSFQAMMEDLGPLGFRTEVLCQSVPNLKAVTTADQWQQCYDKGSLDAYREKVCLGFDAYSQGGVVHATLVAAAALPDGRVRVDTVKEWDTLEDARDALPDLVKKIHPQALAWMPGGSVNVLAPVLRGIQDAEDLTGEQASGACMDLVDLIATTRLAHSSDPLLTQHILRTSPKRTGTDGAWKFDRELMPIDASTAMAAAVHLVRNMPEQELQIWSF